MALKILGEHPLARDEQGNLKSRIATIFLRGNLLVTLPGVHATQRLAYSDYLNSQRQSQGLEPLTAVEEETEWNQSVDLIMEGGVILIRPDPENMAAAFAADDLLQELVSKPKIRFLQLMDERVREAIRERGECWRISPLPQSPDEMQRMIQGARIGIGDRVMYYYSMITGVRYLTYQEFAQLGTLGPAALARYLREIQECSGRQNRLHQPEVDFFGANPAFGAGDFAGVEFPEGDPARLRAAYEALKARFGNAVPPELRQDDPAELEWRNRLFSALLGHPDRSVGEEILRGLSPEFFMQIQWLPGGRIEDGEFMFDQVFDELDKRPVDDQLVALSDEKAKGFIFNFIREFGDVEYVNIGRVASSLSRRPLTPGRRGVYIAEIKRREQAEPVVRIIRLQKWDIQQHLDEGKSLLEAIMQSEEYTEYIFDRRLGCRQLGMNLPLSFSTWRIHLPYRGLRREYQGQTIWITYFVRDYIRGVATDKIAPTRYQSREFARSVAGLLGRAAVPSLIVGKTDLAGKALFDDGDEVLVEDANGMPDRILSSDPTGTFASYANRLEDLAQAYAGPVNRRLALLPEPAAFAEAYLAGFLEQFEHIQREYRDKKRGFDSLFKHRRRDERGSFAYRWEKVLERLDRTDAHALADCVRRHFALR